jgi:hypothetical protein
VYKRDAGGRLRYVLDGAAAEFWEQLREAAPSLNETFTAADVGNALGMSARHGPQNSRAVVHSDGAVHRPERL